MSMKPIEPGCLAIVIDVVNRTERIGSVVKVLHRTPEHDYVFMVPAWRIEAVDNYVAREDHLMRIDGGEDESLTVEDEQEVTA